MALPFFYINNYDATQKEIVLDEDTSKHIVQVLRMKVGEQLNLTDGKGNLLTCSIINDNKKHCSVKIVTTSYQPPSNRKVSIAISLLKNSNRFEWFLEKATEIGVSEIIPLMCKRTEKEKFRFDRMQGIVISAMLQSQQCRLPILNEPVQFQKFIQESTSDTKLIAHCIEGDKRRLSHFLIAPFSNFQICIGPEGDFTNEEIETALQNNFTPISLGERRLRTETAGVVAAALLC